jgi:hypothetical protein
MWLPLLAPLRPNDQRVTHPRAKASGHSLQRFLKLNGYHPLGSAACLPAGQPCLANARKRPSQPFSAPPDPSSPLPVCSRSKRVLSAQLWLQEGLGNSLPVKIFRPPGELARSTFTTSPSFEHSCLSQRPVSAGAQAPPEQGDRQWLPDTLPSTCLQPELQSTAVSEGEFQ